MICSHLGSWSTLITHDHSQWTKSTQWSPCSLPSVITGFQATLAFQGSSIRVVLDVKDSRCLELRFHGLSKHPGNHGVSMNISLLGAC